MIRVVILVELICLAIPIFGVSAMRWRNNFIEITWSEYWKQVIIAHIIVWAVIVWKLNN